MKRTVSLLLALLLGLTLAACGPSGAESTPPEGSGTPGGSQSAQPGGGEASSQPQVSENSGGEASSQPQIPENSGGAGESPLPEQGALPYLQKVVRADQLIFEGPSYDERWVGAVKQPGTYTIVEEAQDWEGNLWGRLKSGAGWIDLTDVRAFDPDKTPVSAGRARDVLLPAGGCHRYTAQADPDSLLDIVIHAYRSIRQVSFTALGWGGDDYVVEELLYTLPELTPQKPLVVEVDFPGDMTTYGLSFLDESGVQRRFTLSISGRNGTVEFHEVPF